MRTLVVGCASLLALSALLAAAKADPICSVASNAPAATFSGIGSRQGCTAPSSGIYDIVATGA